MAVISPTVENCIDGDPANMRITWAAMANGDSGSPAKFPQWADRSIQVLGTFGAAGNLRWEGSNDETNYVALTDGQGNALDFTAAKIEGVQEVPLVTRPRVTAGDGTTSITVVAIFRRNQPQRV